LFGQLYQTLAQTI